MKPPTHSNLDLSDVFAYVDTNRQAFLDRLIAYLRQPSISAHGIGIAEVAEFLVEQLESPFTEPIRQGILAAQSIEPLLIPSAGGSLPDYVFTKILGIPAFGVPYANPDESNHAPNENLEIERFFAGIKTGAAMLTHLGAMR